VDRHPASLVVGSIAGLVMACGPANTPARPGPARLGGAIGDGAPTDATPAPGPPTETLTKDTARVTPAGVAYVAPAGWSRAASGAIAILTAQDGESRVAIVDSTATDADAAVAEAWSLYRSAPPPPLALAVDAPARDGWDQIRQYTYQTSPDDRRVVASGALRHGTRWAVVLVDAREATVNQRSAQFRLVSESVRPVAHARESFHGRPANRLDATRLARLDQFIEIGRAELGIPGVSLAIVQDGRVIHARGYGVRALGSPAPVDVDTLYLIASNTKALTTLLLAALVDAGTLAWDQPVTEIYPAFALGDAATTAATRVRHLVGACTGLPRKDLEWLFQFANATALTELRYLAETQPTPGFGETYQYSNLLAAAAGYVAAYALSPTVELGAGYDAAMQARVFGPLAMTATTFDVQRALAGNHASPHGRDVDGRPAVAPMDLNHAIYPLRPAGGAWSSASDLVKYVQLELGHGVTPAGERIVSERNLLERRKPSVALGEDATYGMGLAVSRRFGVTVVDHGGSMIGFRSDMVWLPDHGVGAVILTNADLGGALLDPFKRYLLELLFDGKPEATEDLRAIATTLRATAEADRRRLTVPADPQAVAALAPRYANPALGPIAVTSAAGAATFDFGAWRTEVASRVNDDGTRSFIAITPGLGGFDFVVGPAGGPRTLTLRDAQHEYVFVETGTA